MAPRSCVGKYTEGQTARRHVSDICSPSTLASSRAIFHSSELSEGRETDEMDKVLEALDKIEERA